MSPERQPNLERRTPEALQVLTDSEIVEIINFSNGTKTRVKNTKEGSEILSFEHLVIEQEKIDTVEQLFGEKVVETIFSGLEYRAAKSVRGAEDIMPELAYSDNTQQLKELIKTLFSFGITEDRVNQIVNESKRQLTSGETHMGITPVGVRNETNRIVKRVARYYEKHT